MGLKCKGRGSSLPSWSVGLSHFGGSGDGGPESLEGRGKRERREEEIL